MILLPAIIEGIRTRKDNTISITLACNEINPHKVGELMGLHNKYSYIAIKPELFTENELKVVEGLKVDEAIGKSHSKRLRAVMYIGFQQNPDGFKEFESYYVNKMETIITHLKSKLDQ